MSLTEQYFFSSPIYEDNSKKNWVDKLNLLSDPYIEKAKNKLKSSNTDGFGSVYHSESFYNDPNFKEFLQYINVTASNILDRQGFDLKDLVLLTSDMWVQEFTSLGGGHHSPHTHWNGHISGFYFLKCSNKTSLPVFHDPRAGRMMNLLPEKNNNNLTLATHIINIKPENGKFVFFNSYLQHEFIVDNGIDPFRFIHFNIQAVPKQLIKGNIKLISS